MACPMEWEFTLSLMGKLFRNLIFLRAKYIGNVKHKIYLTLSGLMGKLMAELDFTMSIRMNLTGNLNTMLPTVTEFTGILLEDRTKVQ